MRMAQASDTPHEAREVIGAMVDAVRRHDPAFVERVDVVGLDAEDIVERGFPAARAGADAFAERFDRSLDGKVAQLVDWSPNAEEVVADAVRAGVRRRRRRSVHRRRARSPAQPGPQSATGSTRSRWRITRR